MDSTFIRKLAADTPLYFEPATFYPQDSGVDIKIDRSLSENLAAMGELRLASSHARRDTTILLLSALVTLEVPRASIALAAALLRALGSLTHKCAPRPQRQSSVHR